MRIAAAQTRPSKGDIPANIHAHLRLTELAVSQGVSFLIFPELSLTGYEPTLAASLATTKEDPRFAVFQQLSDAHAIIIGVGMPVSNKGGAGIGMLIFQPQQSCVVYFKQFLHADELPFFTAGNQFFYLNSTEKIAPAICYEISVPAHAATVFQHGAQVYAASVAKSVQGMGTALERLSFIAKEYSMMVLFSNCLGLCDNMECGGSSAVWNSEGDLLAQLNDKDEGIVFADTVTAEAGMVYLFEQG